ncbi:MAG: hypothetical protein NWR72_15270 [Bacteroidia bacterium]|nr:hypothetical protein [Bacteroidia bacterium]
MKNTSFPSPFICLLSGLMLIFPGCVEKTPAASDEPEGSHARMALGIVGPGAVVGNFYENPTLQLELPIPSGWEIADRSPVQALFEAWDSSQGVDSLPATFLLSAARILPDGAVGIKSNYFLQIEPASYYPDFASDPALYLTAVGEQLAQGAGQQILYPVRVDTLGQRAVQRLDVGFSFGEYPGKQTYYTWQDKGLFVNLVFTYADDSEWTFFSSQIIDGIHLE